MTQTQTFAQQIADTRAQVRTLIPLAQPLPPAMLAWARENSPANAALAEASVADAAEKLAAAQERLAELEACACQRCDGRGEYAGASRYQRRGVRFCFACDGSGHRKGCKRH